MVLSVKITGYPVGTVGVGVVPVEAELVQDIGEDEQAAGQAHGQTEQVDEGNEFVFRQVAEGDLQIVPDHRHRFSVIRTSGF
jgi:hypothetical protein